MLEEGQLAMHTKRRIWHSWWVIWSEECEEEGREGSGKRERAASNAAELIIPSNYLHLQRLLQNSGSFVSTFEEKTRKGQNFISTLQNILDVMRWKCLSGS